nr:uncharacterized protein LOC104102378 [Nicotiana tomentosiformis]
MGFAEHFINLIWSLLSNNWYSILVNSQSSRFFKSFRGVKQGDPLSPALFILSAEVLSRSLNNLFDDKSFVGFGMPKWTDPLNHPAYADDTIIFASSHTESLKKIMAVLNGYEKISGQLINNAKSSYYMHSKAANALFQTVGDLTRFTRGTFPFTYRGCPIFYTRRRKDYYDDHINKVKAKLHSWKGKLLSFGGKATLISSVLQSMPIHMLSLLDPPKNIIEHLHKLFARFFWSKRGEGRNRHVHHGRSCVFQRRNEGWVSDHCLMSPNHCLQSCGGGLGALYHLVREDFHINEEFEKVVKVRQENGWNEEFIDQSFPEAIADHIKQHVQFEGSDGFLDVQRTKYTHLLSKMV